MTTISLNFKTPEEETNFYEAKNGRDAFSVVRHLRSFLKERTTSAETAAEKFTYEEVSRFLEMSIASYDLEIR